GPGPTPVPGRRQPGRPPEASPHLQTTVRPPRSGGYFFVTGLKSAAPTDSSKYTQSAPALQVASCGAPPGMETYEPAPSSFLASPSKLNSSVPEIRIALWSCACVCMPSAVPPGIFLNDP